MEYQLVRSARRKRIAIQVCNQRVVVRAPEKVCENYVKKLVVDKQAWIEQHLQIQASNAQFRCNFTHNSPILANGTLKKIRVASGNGFTVEETSSYLDISIIDPKRESRERVKKALEQYFKAQAHHYIPTKTQFYADLMSTQFNGLNIRRYNARWGSCNNQGRLSFNYLLMMAPSWVIDYVIVHELSHRFHMNHSQAFWRKVAQFYPNYHEAKAWFKTHQGYLHWSL